MTVFKNVNITSQDSPSIDAFGRWRVSNPETIFDSKQIFDNSPLFWDDAEVTGTGTSSSHSVNTASTTMSVGTTTAGKRVRQTFRSFNYEPGKSQYINQTFSQFITTTGITKEVGIFNDDNGLFLRSDSGTISFVRRTKVSGTAVDNVDTQANWNIDKMDGAGDSEITLDFTKTQILVIDFEWLGVGRVRFGFVVDGIIYYVHELLNANNLSVVYMSTPNLPLRYSIENNGTGASSSFEHICSTVITEGGSETTGVVRYKSTQNTAINANSSGTLYAVVGIRLKAAALGATINPVEISMLSGTNDNFEWVVLFNPTIAGTFTYSDLTDSVIQAAIGVTANTVTGGYEIDGGFSRSSESKQKQINSALTLGASIDGTRDEIVLCVRPLSSNANIFGSLTWRELL